VHIGRENNEAKFWVAPVELAYNRGFNKNEIIRLKALVFENIESIRSSWDEYFDK
jgi:hypothetical protein